MEFIDEKHPLYQENPLMKMIMEQGYSPVLIQQEEGLGVEIAAMASEVGSILISEKFLTLEPDVQHVIIQHEIGHDRFANQAGMDNTRNDEVEFQADLYAAIQTDRTSVLRMLDALTENVKETTKDDPMGEKMFLVNHAEIKRRKEFMNGIELTTMPLKEKEGFDVLKRNEAIAIVNHCEEMPYLTCLGPEKFVAKASFFEDFTSKERNLLYIYEFCHAAYGDDTRKINEMTTKLLSEEDAKELEEAKGKVRLLDTKREIVTEQKLGEIKGKAGTYQLFHTKDERIEGHLPVIDNKRNMYLSEECLQVFGEDIHRKTIVSQEIAKRELGFLKSESLSEKEDVLAAKETMIRMVINDVPEGKIKEGLYEANKREVSWLKVKEIKEVPYEKKTFEDAKIRQQTIQGFGFDKQKEVAFEK